MGTVLMAPGQLTQPHLSAAMMNVTAPRAAQCAHSVCTQIEEKGHFWLCFSFVDAGSRQK